MRTDFISFHAGALLSDAARPFIKGKDGERNQRHRQRLYPVLDDAGRLVGLTTRRDMLNAALAEHTPPDATIGSRLHAAPILPYPADTLRALTYPMRERTVNERKSVE